VPVAGFEATLMLVESIFGVKFLAPVIAFGSN